MDVAAVVADEGMHSQGVVGTAQLRRAGVSRSQLSRAVAAGAVVRVRAGVYALAGLSPLPRFVVTDVGVDPSYVAHVRAVLLGLGDSATACGRTAAALHGWGLLVEPSRTVEVAVPHGRSSAGGRFVRAVQRRTAAGHRRVILPDTDPVWTTTPVQTVIDCALDLPLLQAVVLCDSALRARDVTVEELVRAAGRLGGVRHARRLRRVLELCDPDSGSVLESVLRVRMLRAGVDGFRSQVVVCDRPGQHVRVDFCFAAAGLVVETDGARWHQDPARDRVRDNALAVLGWRVLRYTWAEVLHEADRVLAEIVDAVACATPSFHLEGDADCAAA